jgi:predicted RNase H-like HicB family nuclease
MIRNFTLEWWRDNDWFVGKLKEVPGIFSQGVTLDELEENIKDAYLLMMEDKDEIPNAEIHSKEIGVEV